MYKIPETHENFTLSKKEHDDQTIGQTNERHLVCTFCKKILIAQGDAVKVAKYVSLPKIYCKKRYSNNGQVGFIKNNMREYDNMNTYWRLDTLHRFQNVEIHGIVGDMKYLCCIGC